MTIGGVISNSSVKFEFGYMQANGCKCMHFVSLKKKVILYTYRHYHNKFADMPPAVLLFRQEIPSGSAHVRITPPTVTKMAHQSVCQAVWLSVLVSLRRALYFQSLLFVSMYDDPSLLPCQGDGGNQSYLAQRERSQPTRSGIPIVTCASKPRHSQ